jgi:hypothetical protein
MVSPLLLCGYSTESPDRQAVSGCSPSSATRSTVVSWWIPGLPLIEAGSRNDAATVFPGFTKGGLLGRRLDASKENLIATRKEKGQLEFAFVDRRQTKV